MNNSLPQMWPDEIRAEVRSPPSILTEVAGSLTSRTRNLLAGEVRRASDEKGRTVLVFDIVVPSLDNYRQRVLRLVYDESRVYPAFVDAESVNPTTMEMLQEAVTPFGSSKTKPTNRADSDSELIGLIQRINRSLVPTVQSLIARANDASKAREAEVRLLEIDDKVSKLGYRYDPLMSEFVAVSGSDGGNGLTHTPQAILPLLDGVNDNEWRDYLKWKKELAEEETFREKEDNPTKRREDDTPADR